MAEREGGRLAHLPSEPAEEPSWQALTAEPGAFQLSPGLHTATYCLAKLGHSCFLQSCLCLLAAALPEPRQPLPPLSFEPINAAGSKAAAPRGLSQPCTAARFAYTTHCMGARASVCSQIVTLHHHSFSPCSPFPNSVDVSSGGLGESFPQSESRRTGPTGQTSASPARGTQHIRAKLRRGSLGIKPRGPHLLSFALTTLGAVQIRATHFENVRD